MALPMMLFFGFHMLLARVPKKKIFSNFLLSRQLIGIALLILATNYSVHLFCSIRLKDVNATILMNMVTYFLCYRLFSAAMMILLENGYMRRSRFALHLWQWLLFTAVAIAVSLLPDNSVAGSVVSDIWIVPFHSLATHLLSSHKDVSRHPLRRYRGLYTLAVGFHILGYRVWRQLWRAYFFTRRVCVFVDFIINTILHLPILLLSKLHSIL